MTFFPMKIIYISLFITLITLKFKIESKKSNRVVNKYIYIEFQPSVRNVCNVG